MYMRLAGHVNYVLQLQVFVKAHKHQKPSGSSSQRTSITNGAILAPARKCYLIMHFYNACIHEARMWTRLYKVADEARYFKTHL